MEGVADPAKGSLPDWAAIVGRVREQHPQIVMSGEGYESWVEMMIADANLGGQGHAAFHVAMQQAVTSGDASQLEGIASTSGADAATVLCYLHPHYDGKQPGACPSQLDPDPPPWLCCPSDRWVGVQVRPCTTETQHLGSGTSSSTRSGWR